MRQAVNLDMCSCYQALWRTKRRFDWLGALVEHTRTKYENDLSFTTPLPANIFLSTKFYSDIARGHDIHPTSIGLRQLLGSLFVTRLAEEWAVSKHHGESSNETFRVSCLGSLPSSRLVRLVERVKRALASYERLWSRTRASRSCILSASPISVVDVFLVYATAVS